MKKCFEAYPTFFDVFRTLSMSDFYIILHFLATPSVVNCVETHSFYIENVF